MFGFISFFPPFLIFEGGSGKIPCEKRGKKRVRASLQDVTQQQSLDLQLQTGI